MRIGGVGFWCVLICSTFTLADQVTVKRDTQLLVQLRTAMATATAKPGAALEFQTTAGVLIGSGIVVPRGSRVFGKVEEVRSGSSAAGAVLRVSLDRLEWDGGSTALNAVVIGVEPSDAEDNPVWRHLHRAVIGRRTMLEHIAVRSHVGRKAFVEFASNRDNFTLHRGVRLALWQVDPETDPVIFVKNPVLEVQSATK
jgi:hypothetical protein